MQMSNVSVLYTIVKYQIDQSEAAVGVDWPKTSCSSREYCKNTKFCGHGLNSLLMQNSLGCVTDDFCLFHYVHGKQLRACRDGRLSYQSFPMLILSG